MPKAEIIFLTLRNNNNSFVSVLGESLTNGNKHRNIIANAGFCIGYEDLL